MEIFGNDWILGDFRASDYGLVLASFTYDGNSDDELGYKTSATEEFVGKKPVSVYLSEKHEDKLRPQITLIKNQDLFSQDMMGFTEKECREILRILTGIKGYQWMKVDTLSGGENIWFRTKLNSISYKRVAGKTVGFIFDTECDSYYGYSEKDSVSINAISDTPFYIYNNTDDLVNYILPTVSITSHSDNASINLMNETDNSWTTEFKNTRKNETLFIDSDSEILSSDINHSLLLDDFNLHFPRLVPGMNKYVCSCDATIVFKFRVPRKVVL